MTKEEYDRLGHITETGNCCICGKEYTDYGNSTWGRVNVKCCGLRFESA